MKYIRIILIAISVLTLISASLTLCRVIPAIPGLVISLSLIVCEFLIQAFVSYKVRNKLSMISYIIAALGLTGVVLYNIFA